MRALLFCVAVGLQAAQPAQAADATPDTPARTLANTGADARQVFDRVASSVVTVMGNNAAGEPEVQGSGVVVADGQVATNCHVVREAAGLQVRAGDALLTAEWTRQIAADDLCLLRVPGLKGQPVRLRASASVQPGEPVFAVGNPLGFGLAVSAGLVAMVQKAPAGGYAVIVATASQSPGSSGGGLFDAEGRLVGLTTATLSAGQNLNRVMSADGVQDLLAATPNGRSAPRTPPPQAVAKGRRWPDEAEALMQSGRWEALEAHAEAWQRDQPTAALPVRVAGLAQARQGRAADAEATLRRALALDPRLPAAWTELADVLYGLGRRPEAERAMAEAETSAPMDPETSRTRARWLHKDGDLAAATAQQREAVRRQPGFGALWVELGRLEDEAGHPAEAALAYASALRLGVAETALRREAKATAVADGDTPESAAKAAIGWREFKAGRFGLAEEAARSALALSPRSGNAWNVLGAVFAQTARLAEADEAFGKAIDVAPKDAVLWSNRAGVRMQLKQYPSALEDARTAVSLDPASLTALRALGKAQFLSQHHRDADASFAQLAGRNGVTTDDRVTWAESLLALGRGDDALTQLKAAEADAIPSPRTNLVMAKTLGARRDYAGAFTYASKAVDAEPVNAIAWSSKGYALMKIGRMPEAVQALETAVRLDPTVSNPWINLGEAQLRTQNIGLAIQALERGLQLSPAAADGRLLLAESYLGARMPAKSRENAQKLLDEQPTFPPALALVTLSYLVEGNTREAAAPFLRLKAAAPEVARNLRSRAVAGGLAAAGTLPD